MGHGSVFPCAQRYAQGPPKSGDADILQGLCPRSRFTSVFNRNWLGIRGR